MPATQNQNISIISWPKGVANLEHSFKESPCPVSITFENPPANVVLKTNPEQPLDVMMTMNVATREALAVCLKICEPICAKSEYTIGIDIFDHPVAVITLRGLTRLFNCKEE
jgi:hypothetical protein